MTAPPTAVGGDRGGLGDGTEQQTPAPSKPRPRAKPGPNPHLRPGCAAPRRPGGICRCPAGSRAVPCPRGTLPLSAPRFFPFPLRPLQPRPSPRFRGCPQPAAPGRGERKGRKGTANKTAAASLPAPRSPPAAFGAAASSRRGKSPPPPPPPLRPLRLCCIIFTPVCFPAGSAEPQPSVKYVFKTLRSEAWKCVPQRLRG